MTACNDCWDEAFRRSQIGGGHQAEHYEAILMLPSAERPWCAYAQTLIAEVTPIGDRVPQPASGDPEIQFWWPDDDHVVFRDQSALDAYVSDAIAAERDALLAKFEALAGRLAAYDCVDAPDDVPLHVDVPDDYEAGIHAAAHDLSNLIREARA